MVVATGDESITLMQNDMNMQEFTEERALRHEPGLYVPMLQAADFVEGLALAQGVPSRKSATISTQLRCDSSPGRVTIPRRLPRCMI